MDKVDYQIYTCASGVSQGAHKVSLDTTVMWREEQSSKLEAQSLKCSFDL